MLKKLFDAALNLVILACAALIIGRLFLYTPYVIPSESMEPTLEIDDRLIGINHVDDVAVGDIVTFTDPDDHAQTLIKRVVAVGGETVDLERGKLVVDGEERDVPEAVGMTWPLTDHAQTLDENVTYPVTVPDGCVFVMGDNREDSADSRFFGYVPVSSITSKVIVRYFPLDRFGLID